MSARTLPDAWGGPARYERPRLDTVPYLVLAYVCALERHTDALEKWLAAAGCEIENLQEALRWVCNVGDRAAVQIARAALSEGEG